MMNVTPFDVAFRFQGTKEVAGSTSNPLVLAMLRLDNKWPTDDEVPWCSAFTNFICFLLGLPRSRSLAARSWLKVGTPVNLSEATPGFDIVILNRAGGSPDPKVDGPGHVGFFAGLDGSKVAVLAGNQSNEVNIQMFDATRILGIRRIG
jgi:uncharacterized protein (TIGR02594 family)